MVIKCVCESSFFDREPTPVQHLLHLAFSYAEEWNMLENGTYIFIIVLMPPVWRNEMQDVAQVLVFRLSRDDSLTHSNIIQVYW